MEKQEFRDVILEAMEQGLQAQLHAVRKMRKPGSQEKPRRQKEGMSQMDIAYDILLKARRPLHVTELIERAQKVHGVRLDRESLVSALSKRVARGDRFIRTEPNTFAVREEEAR
jgi:hypothetical protein